MKSKIIMIFLFFVLAAPVSAQCNTELCVAPYDLSFGLSRVFSNLTGSNYLGQNVAQMLIKKEVKKVADVSKLKVKVRSYSVRDLKAGRFKAIELSADDINFDGIYFSKVEAKTLCDFNYIQPIKKSSEVFFKETFPVTFRVKMSEENLNKTVESSQYRALINDLNDIGLFKIVSTSVKIRANRFLYVIRFQIPFVKKIQEVVVSSDLAVENGEIAFSNTKLINSRFEFDVNNISNILNYLNPLDYSLNIMENKDTKLKIKNVSIEDNLVVLDGMVTVLKDTAR